MILRVLWPAVTKSPDPDSPSLLLGAIFTSQQQSEQVLTVAVISICPAELLEPLARLQQQLSQTSVSLPTQPAVNASLAVVGLWRPSSSTQRYISNPGEQIGSQYGLWLAVHGHSMALPQYLGNSQRQQQPAMAPTCDLQLSTLPHGIQSVQVSSSAALFPFSGTRKYLQKRQPQGVIATDYIHPAGKWACRCFKRTHILLGPVLSHNLHTALFVGCSSACIQSQHSSLVSTGCSCPCHNPHRSCLG